MSEKGALAVKNRRTCYDCGKPIRDPNAQVCPHCGGSDVSERKARPTRRIFGAPHVILPDPWDGLELDLGSTILLSGGAGSGKTTISLKCKPRKYATSEQEIDKIHEDWHRIVGQHFPDQATPAFSMVYSWEHLEEDVADIEEGDILVVDSISQLAASIQTVDIMRKVVEKVRFEGAIAIFIAQYTKDGDMLGPNMLRHLVDVVAEIPEDSHGLRRLAVYKNRFGSTFSNYFVINSRGVEKPTFPYAYTVEGNPGRYSLHLYPMSGAKYDGIFNALLEGGGKVHHVASSAIQCGLYEGSFAEPPDAEDRKRFALRHGLMWLDPETYSKILVDMSSAQSLVEEAHAKYLREIA